jgi:hypothetical protein
MLLALDLLAEAKLAEAVRAGAFDNLPGAGRPVQLDDDRMIPEDLRLAHRILKNAGFVPPEVETRREAAGLRRLIAAATDAGERSRAATRLALLEMTLERGGRGLVRGSYRERLLRRFDRAL